MKSKHRNITVIGSGPAGLYFALLRKRRHPEDDVRVFERGSPRATVGWGISLPGTFMDLLKSRDPQTYEILLPGMVRWENTSVRWKREIASVKGGPFFAIERRELVGLLAELCHDNGVDVTWNAEVVPSEAFLSENDFVVACDGTNSRFRHAFEEAFQPKTCTGRNMFRWLGVDRVYSDFRFLFKEEEDGIFNAYLYPFSATSSTFVVECDGAAFAPTKLDINHLERLFLEQLEGGHLIGDRSPDWRNFQSVANDRLFHRNLVLLGDAAHSLHFSIGSGTMLAMEDAWELAECLESNSSIEENLNRFEKTRRPIIDHWALAAHNSRMFFENLALHLNESMATFCRRLFERRRGQVHHSYSDPSDTLIE